MRLVYSSDPGVVKSYYYLEKFMSALLKLGIYLKNNILETKTCQNIFIRVFFIKTKNTTPHPTTFSKKLNPTQCKPNENKMKIQEFLGGVVVRTLHLHCWGPGFEPLLAN